MEDGYFWVNGKKYKSMHEEVPPITKEMSKEMTIQLGMPYHDLPMFLFDYVITGDAVMMLALTEALIAGYNDLEKTKREIKKSTKKWMSKYPSLDYTSRSPVIISSVAWLYNTPGTVKEYSEICAIEMGYEKEQTKDVIACAEVIFMAKSGTDKNIIKQQLIRKYVLAFNDMQVQGDDISGQLTLANKIISAITEATGDDEFDGSSVEEKAQQLLAVVKKQNNIVSVTDKIDIPRPETSLAASSLFTGSLNEPSMMTELKKEICSADRVDMLVSFIKWSGLRLIINELNDFTMRGGKLRIRV